MKDYLVKSFKKFKDDALSKLLYDLGKLLLGALIPYLLLQYLPNTNSIVAKLNEKSAISYLNLIFIIVFVIVLTALIVTYLTNKRYNLIKKDLNTDELTGIPNNRALTNELKEVVDWAKTSNSLFSVILIDIDDFKNFNTTYGLTVADKILIKLANLLKSDSRITDKLFRQHVKGDEFVIIARNTNLQNAILAANRKKNTIAETDIEIHEHNQVFKLTVCCGVTEYTNNDTPEAILERGFKAMKNAKGVSGKNSVKSLI